MVRILYILETFSGIKGKNMSALYGKKILGKEMMKVLRPNNNIGYKRYILSWSYILLFYLWSNCQMCSNVLNYIPVNTSHQDI